MNEAGSDEDDFDTASARLSQREWVAAADLQRSADDRGNDRRAAVVLLDVDVETCCLKQSEVLSIVRAGLALERCQSDVDDGRGLRGGAGAAEQRKYDGERERSVQCSHMRV